MERWSALSKLGLRPDAAEGGGGKVKENAHMKHV